MSTDPAAGFAASRPDLKKKWGGRAAPILHAHLAMSRPDLDAATQRANAMFDSYARTLMRLRAERHERRLRRGILNGESFVRVGDPFSVVTMVYDLTTSGACDATGFP